MTSTRKRLRASACGRSVEDPCIQSSAEVTARIAARSADSRSAYLERIRAAAADGPARGDLGCANLAHGFAACGADEKLHLRAGERRNVAIVSAYNDMLSAHQPLERYPAILKKAVLQAGGVAQFAGGVPAMCDGITQGRAGMELSLFSRDVVAMATAVALSHDMFDGALMLGVCDKIVPGPADRRAVLRPPADRLRPRRPDAVAGCPNAEKSRIRQLHAEGEVGREELLEAELASYHSPGTCTFYGTANSNQLVVEAMGLHLPGRELRQPRHAAAPRADRGGRPRAPRRAARRSARSSTSARWSTASSRCWPPAARPTTRCTSSRSPPRRACALTWDDFADLSAVVPLLARVYPNGPADINHFHAAGGMPFLIGELLDAGLMHPDVDTVAGLRPRPLPRRAVPRRGRRAALAPGRARVARRRRPAARRATRSRPTAASACSTARSAAR